MSLERNNNSNEEVKFELPVGKIQTVNGGNTDKAEEITQLDNDLDTLLNQEKPPYYDVANEIKLFIFDNSPDDLMGGAGICIKDRTDGGIMKLSSTTGNHLGSSMSITFYAGNSDQKINYDIFLASTPEGESTIFRNGVVLEGFELIRAAESMQNRMNLFNNRSQTELVSQADWIQYENSKN